MTTPHADARNTLVESARTELAAWSRRTDGLIGAFASAPPVPGLTAKLEELRNRRDTVAVKVEALRRHRGERLRRAVRDHDEACREMRAAWRSVLAALQRDAVTAGHRARARSTWTARETRDEEEAIQ